MSSTQVLKVKVLSCGGLRDLMSEMEASFLVSALGLFRNQHDFGKAKPRANVNFVRAYTADDFYDAAFGESQLLHVVGHANGSRLEVGTGKAKVLATDLGKKAAKYSSQLPTVVVSTGCEMQSLDWRVGLKAAGAEMLIASSGNVSPANVVAFDMAFYSALLSQTRRGKSLLDRVEESFEIADAHYRRVHALGTPFAKFKLERL